MADASSELPLSCVRTVVKAKLLELTGGDEKREVAVQKEALQALSEAAKIFIHYLTATANEVCHESKRLTISANDVYKALEEIDFPEFAEPLKEALAGTMRPSTSFPPSLTAFPRSVQGVRRSHQDGKEAKSGSGARNRSAGRRGSCG
jgi:DNA polymerase epsilon subunit 3